MTNSRDERVARLAEALRANLRKRKGSQKLTHKNDGACADGTAKQA